MTSADSVAVVGMACYLPGASGPDQYWKLLLDGHEAIRRIPESELRAAGVTTAELSDSDFVGVSAALEGPDQFDASFFRLSPRDAAVMDPQHRKFLECSWEALEHAGFRPDDDRVAIGVFAGCGMNWYYLRNLNPNRRLVEELGHFAIRHTANDKDFLATRVSYQFDLRGPSVTIQTACSTSLVAIHAACQSLLAGECDLAIAGGATIETPVAAGYRYREGEVLSPDGRCRPFDDDANGTVFGSGCAAVVLRRLDDAVRDRDTVHAIILGSAVNNDGARKVGYMAPSVDGHADVIEEALALADVDPRSVGYVEAHGTGTKLGDPIEFAAFRQAFGSDDVAEPWCAIGSVKGNIGHLDTAAGAASFIKAVLAVQHGVIPPTVHLNEINREIRSEGSPFFLTSRRHPWGAPSGGARRAGVSSLGVGGTNAHVILEEATEELQRDSITRPILFPLSARSPRALTAGADRLGQFLEDHPTTNLDDTAYTLRHGRVPFEYRACVVAATPEQLTRSLAALPQTDRASGSGRIAFLLPGQGSQFPGMARALYQAGGDFKSTFDHCVSEVRRAGGPDITAAIEGMGADGRGDELTETAVTQPAVFAVEYSLAVTLRSFGVLPFGMLGHSLGEYVAACLSGVFSLEDALEIVVERGRLMQGMQQGSMLAVMASQDDVRGRLPQGLDLAAANGPEAVVVSGSPDAIARFAAGLERDGIMARGLRTSHAFHSRHMDDVVAPLQALVASKTLGTPSVPFVSNVTGTWITPEQATSPAYWATHARQPVLFSDGLETLLAASPDALLEVGPGGALTRLASTHAEPSLPVSQTLGDARSVADGTEQLLEALGLVWTAGVELDWEVANPSEGRRIPLPTYAFERTRHWIEAPDAPVEATSELVRRDVDSWFYVPAWHPSPLRIDPSRLQQDRIWVISDGSPTLDAVSTQLRGEGNEVFLTLVPDDSSDPPEAMFERLIRERGAPSCVVVGTAYDPERLSRDVQAVLDSSFAVAVALARALTGALVDQPAEIVFCVRDLLPVPGSAPLSPVRAALAGVCKVVPAEHPELTCRLVDGDDANLLVQELRSADREQLVTYRNGDRLVPSLVPVDLRAAAPVERSRVCLVTGAFGGIGREVTDWLATNRAEALVLVGRAAEGSAPRRDARRSVLARLDAASVPYLVCDADVTQAEAMTSAVRKAAERFGRIDEVYHLAGKLDDGLISRKTVVRMYDVLGPKVLGTIVLDDALVAAAQAPLVILFSSISAHVGVAGQVDYAAANAFLDYWALCPRRPGEPSYRVIDWGMWSEVGMAAALERSLAVADIVPDESESLAHPILKQHGRRRDGAEVFWGDVRARDCWVLDDHRMRDGSAVMPATGYLDLILFVARELIDQGALEIENLTLLSPMTFVGTATRTVVVTLTSGQRGYDVVIESAGGRDDLVQHAQGSVRATAETPGEAPDVAAPASTAPWDPGSHPLLEFGPRWSRLGSSVGAGVEPASVHVDVWDPERDPAEDLYWHPALVDVATGAPLTDREGPVVPFSFRRVVAFRTVGESLKAVMTRRHVGASNETVLGGRLFDDRGEVGLIEGFVHRPPATGSLRAPSKSRLARRTGSVTDLGARVAIGPRDGLEALGRVVDATGVSQVLVSPVPIPALREALLAAAGDSDPDDGTLAVAAPRPALAVEFVPPATEPEKIVAAAWARHLGLSEVGLDDDFFELGGHSLLLTRILQDLRRDHQVTVPISEAFDAPTVRKWVSAADAASDAAGVPRIDREQFRVAASEIGDVL